MRTQTLNRAIQLRELIESLERTIGNLGYVIRNQRLTTGLIDALFFSLSDTDIINLATAKRIEAKALQQKYLEELADL